MLNIGGPFQKSVPLEASVVTRHLKGLVRVTLLTSDPHQTMHAGGSALELSSHTLQPDRICSTCVVVMLSACL